MSAPPDNLISALSDRYRIERELGSGGMASDTSGWSNRSSYDGGIIYAQGPAQSSARFIRVIPNWVNQMKAAVDSVNR